MATIASIAEGIERRSGRPSVLVEPRRQSRPLPLDPAQYCSRCQNNGWVTNGEGLAIHCRCLQRRLNQKALAAIPVEQFGKPKLSRLEPRADIHAAQIQAVPLLKAEPDASYLLCGSNGSGKSHFAWALYRHAIASHRRAVACSLNHLLGQYRDWVLMSPNERRSAQRDRTQLRPLILSDDLSSPVRQTLFIDEFEKAGVSELGTRMLFELLNSVRDFGHQLIVTSNKDWDQLREHWSRIDEVYGKRKKYLLNLYSLLRRMFEVAVENEKVDQSPVRRTLHRPVAAGEGKGGAKTKKPALSGAEIRRVLLELPHEHRTLFNCVALTGMRVGELLALRWSNVDFARSELSITHSLWRRQLVTPKTEASERTLHLPAVLTEMLATHQQGTRFNSPEDFVFAREDGSPQDPDHLRKEVLYQALVAAGFKPGYRSHGFHLFRHSAGSIVHSITRDVKTAQELLGHSRLSTTADIYTHVDKAVGEEASEALAKAILPDLDIALASEKVQ